MSWEEFKQRLHESRLLWDLPRPDDLRTKLPVEARRRIEDQDSRRIQEELRSHWMNMCSNEMINQYGADLISDQVGLLAQREIDDFDIIIEDCAETKADRINMRQYISLLVFEEDDLRRPWNPDEDQ